MELARPISNHRFCSQKSFCRSDQVRLVPVSSRPVATLQAWRHHSCLVPAAKRFAKTRWGPAGLWYQVENPRSLHDLI